MPTRSYIKIFGRPILEAIRELEKLAVDMPEVCIMDYVIQPCFPNRLKRYA